MGVDQRLLLEKSKLYFSLKQPSSSASHPQLKNLFIIAEPKTFRMVEGLIVLMREVNLYATFTWESGYLTDKERTSFNFNLKNRVAFADIVLFLITEESALCDYCAQALLYSKLINKPLYVVRTICDSTLYSYPNIEQFNELDFIKADVKGSRFIAKTRNWRHTSLWKTITNASQL